MLCLENPRDFKNKLRTFLINMTLKTHESTDADFYELIKYYDNEGILQENEYLLARIRQ